MLTEYEQTLLSGWEEVHKKSQLTLWILLAIKHSPKQMQEVKEFIAIRTAKTLSADDKSMYRALRRLAEADMIGSVPIKTSAGPDAKQFELTTTGQKVLTEFINSNIKPIYLNDANVGLFR
jgi:DNA-binding PadR family transcriptional regulator